VDIPGVRHQLIQEMLKTMWNIKKRRQHELSSAQDLLQTFESKPDTLTEAQKKQLKLLRDIVDRLDKAIIQLDQTLMVLRDF
jgi:hypothetical protein